MIRSLMDAELDKNEQIEELGRKLDQTMFYMKLDEGTYLIYEYPADSYAPVYFFISDYPDDLLVCLASADPGTRQAPRLHRRSGGAGLSEQPVSCGIAENSKTINQGRSRAGLPLVDCL